METASNESCQPLDCQVSDNKTLSAIRKLNLVNDAE